MDRNVSFTALGKYTVFVIRAGLPHLPHQGNSPDLRWFTFLLFFIYFLYYRPGLVSPARNEVTKCGAHINEGVEAKSGVRLLFSVLLSHHKTELSVHPRPV